MMIQIISAFVGSIGFAIFFKMKGKQIPLAGFGGAITWAVYLSVQSQVEGYWSHEYHAHDKHPSLYY